MDAINTASALGHGPLASLQLALRHRHGRQMSGVLPMEPHGCGMGEALGFGEERLNAGQWEDAQQCRLEPVPGAGWRLANHSRTVVCSINGERVMAGAARPVAPGDMLEVGWLHFEVQAALATQPDLGALGTPVLTHDNPVVEALPMADMTAVDPPQAMPIQAAQPPSTPAADTPAPEFDLRQLAHPADDGRFGPTGADAQDDPFGVLDIVGAEYHPPRDTLAELLGEAAVPGPDRGRGFGAPGRSATADEPTPAERPTGAEDALAEGSAQPLEGLFDRLHEEFVRVVRDPTQLAGRAEWNDVAAPGFERSTTLEALSHEAARFPLMRDILEPREHLDDVLDGFMSLGRETLFDIREEDDVLRLFAPAQTAAARRSVPSLSRRDHHGLSPDSYIDMAASRHDPQPQPQSQPQAQPQGGQP